MTWHRRAFTTLRLDAKVLILIIIIMSSVISNTIISTLRLGTRMFILPRRSSSVPETETYQVLYKRWCLLCWVLVLLSFLFFYYILFIFVYFFVLLKSFVPHVMSSIHLSSIRCCLSCAEGLEAEAAMTSTSRTVSQASPGTPTPTSPALPYTPTLTVTPSYKPCKPSL